jgi:glutamate formiminotransferase
VTLLAVPNVSEGRDHHALDAIGAAFGGNVRLLDRHVDPDHHRAVFTLAGEPGTLAPALLGGAREAVRRIDLRRQAGATRGSGRSTSRRSSSCARRTALRRRPRRSTPPS